jgi:hypothetical protein
VIRQSVLVTGGRKDSVLSLKDLMSGYGGFAFPLPSIAGKYEGNQLVICGDAACVWSDLEAFGCRDDDGRGKVRKSGWDFMVVNKLGETFPGWIAHWYSNMPRVIERSIAARREEYTREFSKHWITHSCNVGADYRWPWGGHGTSGLGSVLVGVGLGYRSIVLCGMPLDDGPHNGEPHWRKTGFASSEAAGGVNDDKNAHWKRAIDLAFCGKVKSMSGRTKAWLGAPSLAS